MLLLREREIIHYLLNNPGKVVTASQLAEVNGCSVRTIKTAIKTINMTFENQSFHIQTKSGKGIWLNFEEKDAEMLLSFIQEPVPDLRTIEIIDILLHANQPVTIQALADQIFSSPSTVHRELLAVEEYLQNFKVTLVKELRKGISLEAPEGKKRSLEATIIKDKVQVQQKTNNFQQIQEHFPQVDIEKIREALQTILTENQLSISDYTYYNLLIHTAIALLRIKERQLVDFQPEEKYFLKEKREWQIAVSYQKLLEQQFQISFPEEETAFLTVHFLSSKVNEAGVSKVENPLGKTEDPLETQLVQWVADISTTYPYPFREDAYFIQNLLLHLRPLLNRLHYGINISNPWLAEVKQRYGQSYEIAIELVSKIEAVYGYKIKEEDIAYLAMHVGASITRFEQNSNQKKQILIVCASGIGMSNFVKAKVEQLFGNELEVIDTVSSVGTNFSRYQCDFILSTIPLEIEGNKVLQVSPLLNESEQEMIRKALKGTVKQESVLAQFIYPELIKTKITATTMEEIIRIGADTLVNHGYVNEAFFEKVLAREAISSTSIGNQIAIPHASDDQIKKEGIAFITLAQPIQGGKESVQVVFLLALSTNSKQRFADIFGDLLTLSQDSKKLKKLIKAMDSQEVKEIFA
jgi:transcriptional antiterminator